MGTHISIGASCGQNVAHRKKIKITNIIERPLAFLIHSEFKYKIGIVKI